MLSQQALAALYDLDGGARFNTLHTVSRELIEAGYAIDMYGLLTISEAGRIHARKRGYRNFAISDLNVSNMGDMNEPRATGHMFEVAPEQLETVQAREQLNADMLPDLENRRRDLAWDRDRVRKAAGVANGACGVWVEAAWIEAFMKAFEHEP